MSQYTPLSTHLLWDLGFCDHQYWILSGTPSGYPVVVLSHGDPAALNQQDSPFHVPQQFTDNVDFGVGQLKSSGSRPLWQLTQSACWHSLIHHQGDFSSTSRQLFRWVSGIELGSLGLLAASL